jgi:Ca-activated chloride channel family protein
MHELKSKNIKEYKELFYYFVALGLLFMLFAFSSLPKRSSTILMIFLSLSFINQPLEARVLDFIDIKKAHQAYKDGNFTEAQKYFEQIKSSTKSAESIYDYANAQYKNKDFKKALENYQRVNAKSDELKYKKLFNIGNSYFKLKEYEKALASYEKAKKIKTEDDLEKNIELTKKMLEKKKQKEQNEKKKKQQKKEKNKDKKDNKDSKNDEKKDQKKKDKDQKDQKNKNSKDKDKDQKKADQQKEQKNNKKISEKEIKKWQEQLEKMKPKTMPIKFQNKNVERKFDEKPW